MDNLQNVIEALLGRKEVAGDGRLMAACTTGKSVMVTGAGGSIGTELCKQLIRYKPANIILFERSEFALYAVENELNEMLGTIAGHESINLVPVLGSIRNASLVEKIIKRYRVNTLYHAAAYKQVPMLERNVIAGVQNNIFGTLVVAKAAEKHHVENFILVSTDKAVRPVNIMGATKRFAEQVLQAFNAEGSSTRFSMVRFGNVLGSSGSVVPLFRKQILNGGPVTVTHPEVTRYFMTAHEAAQLVIQAGSLARGGEVFVLDMKKPIRIADMARKMITLMGYEVCEDCEVNACNCERGIAIRYSGLREGEKLYEELLIGKTVAGTAHPGIMRAVEDFLDWKTLDGLLNKLEYGCNTMDQGVIRSTLAEAIEGFGRRPTILEQEAVVAEDVEKVEALAVMEKADSKVAVLSH